jgi:DNA-binding GntR family transcriptional regulator
MIIAIKDQPAPDAAASLIAAAFERTAASRLPKHARLYDAIAAEIDAARLDAGEKLPGERELCAATGISLGTVQKALSLLVADGRIVREHGRGTFVRTGRRPMTELWHYRFRDPVTRTLLPAFARLVGRTQVPADAAVRAALGEDRAGYVRVTRIVSIGDRFRCWSEMHLPFARFAALLDMPEAEIESVNLKRVLATAFNAPTLATSQTVLLHAFPADIAQQIGVAPRAPGLSLQITATSRGGVPISFQRIYVPRSDCEMEIGADAAPETAAAAA